MKKSARVSDKLVRRGLPGLQVATPVAKAKLLILIAVTKHKTYIS